MIDPELLDGIAFYVIFIFSATLHEAAHAWAAKRGGDLTAYHEGQVSIDPWPHIRREPIGMVVLPVMSVLVSGWPLGFASAPYDPHWAEQHPKRAALMALAGPGANLLIVLVTGLLLTLGFTTGLFFAPDSITFGRIAGGDGGMAAAAAFLLGALFCQNLLLFVFNMLPLPPLDGSSALPLLLTEQSGAAYREFIAFNPAVMWMGLFFAWQIFDQLFDPVFLLAVNALYPGVWYQ